MRLAVAVLAGIVGCASGQVHVPQADVAQRLDELRRDREIRAVATNGQPVRLTLNRSYIIDQNMIGEGTLTAPLAELIAGCLAPPDARLDGYALELEGRPCPLANAQFLTVGGESMGPERRGVGGGQVLFWLLFGVVALVGGVVAIGLCVAGDDRC